MEIPEKVIDIDTRLKLLEKKFEIIIDLLEKEGIIRNSDIEDNLD